LVNQSTNEQQDIAMYLSYDIAIGIVVITLSVCAGIVIASYLKSAAQEIIAPYLTMIVGIVIAATIALSHGYLWQALGW
jgi:hypothetical protein